MTVIKDFLLQLTFIAIPMFTYHLFFAERLRSTKHETVVKFVIWGLSLMLCMSFPASLGEGYRLDIRLIPLLLGTLYGGFRTGMFLLCLLIIYRMYIGIDVGFYITVLVMIFSFPVIFFFQKSFNTAKKEKKVKITLLLSFYYCLVRVACMCVLGLMSLGNVNQQIIHLIFVVVVTGLFTLLNEHIREIHQLRLEVQNSERFRVISDLTSVFAHEIRNPMQVTRGFLQLLNEPDLPDKKKEYIQLSIEELDRANEIINDLLSFGKPSVNNKEKFDIGHQLHRVINIVQTYSASQNVEIQTDIRDGCQIHANTQKFNQSMINILKNAIESMLDGGMVHISCHPTDDGYINITVEDQGVGMTKEQMERLGSPYYSLKESGTGLGMMVSFQIIRSFQGKIRVTSEKGIGTKFSILFPIAT
jgi:two-component system, sporulation sensor kinase B